MVVRLGGRRSAREGQADQDENGEARLREKVGIERHLEGIQTTVGGGHGRPP